MSVVLQNGALLLIERKSLGCEVRWSMSADDLGRIPFARTLAGQAIASAGAGAGNDHQTLSANPILKPHLLPAKIKW